MNLINQQFTQLLLHQLPEAIYHLMFRSLARYAIRMGDQSILLQKTAANMNVQKFLYIQFPLGSFIYDKLCAYTLPEVIIICLVSFICITILIFLWNRQLSGYDLLSPRRPKVENLFLLFQGYSTSCSKLLLATSFTLISNTWGLLLLFLHFLFHFALQTVYVPVFVSVFTSFLCFSTTPVKSRYLIESPSVPSLS